MLTDKEQRKIVKETIKEIAELIRKYRKSNVTNENDAYRTITDYASEVLVRSDWHSVWDNWPNKEYCIVISTTSLAIRLIGDLDENAIPANVEMQYQENYQENGWKIYPLSEKEKEVVLAFARKFDFE